MKKNVQHEFATLKSTGKGKPPDSRGYKTFSMLNSAEHEIYLAHKY